MHTAAILLAASTLGVDYGWQPLPGGQLEYIIQIEPELIDTLLTGVPIRSEIPPEVRGVRRFRVQIGRDSLPRREAVKFSENPRESSKPGEKSPPPLAPPEIQARFDSPKWDEQRQPPRDSDALAAQSATLTKPPFAAHDESAYGASIRPNAGESSGAPAAAPTAQPSVASADPNAKPWGWLTAAIVALFASVGVNLYQGWMMASVRRRYHALVDDLPPNSPPGVVSRVG